MQASCEDVSQVTAFQCSIFTAVSHHTVLYIRHSFKRISNQHKKINKREVAWIAVSLHTGTGGMFSCWRVMSSSPYSQAHIRLFGQVGTIMLGASKVEVIFSKVDLQEGPVRDAHLSKAPRTHIHI